VQRDEGPVSSPDELHLRPPINAEMIIIIILYFSIALFKILRDAVGCR